MQRALEPHYGFGKFRVGVRIDPADSVPANTTTAGSVFSYAIGGPPGDPGVGTTEQCTTRPATGDDGTTFCPDAFITFPGTSVTVTQIFAPAGLRRDVGSVTGGPVDCGGDAVCPAVDLLLTDCGDTSPIAADDRATVLEGGRVDIDVLSNRFDPEFSTAQGAPRRVIDVERPGAAPTRTVTPAPVAPAGPGGRDTLASTGGPVGAGLLAGLGVFLSGAGALLLRRRRKPRGRRVG